MQKVIEIISKGLSIYVIGAILYLIVYNLINLINY